MTIKVEKEEFYYSVIGGNLTHFRVLGTKEQLLTAGMVAESDFPEGRKRYRTRWINSRLWKLQKQAGAVWELRVENPAEPLRILIEIAALGNVVPPHVLMMAWKPGAKEGPVRTSVT